MRSFNLAGLGALLLAATPAVAQSVGFDTFSREDAVTDYRQVLTIDGLGNVVLTTQEGPGPSIVDRGKATSDQLQALDAALRRARFLELPAGTPGRGGGFVYRMTPPGGATKSHTDGLGQNADRLRPIDGAVAAIIEHVLRSRAIGFDTFSREDAVTDYRQVLTVDGLGNVVLTTRNGPGPSVVDRGKATPAELRALDAALRRARFLELPAGTPGRGGGFVYRMTPPGGATKSHADGLGQHADRLRPIDRAVEAIKRSIEKPRASSFDTFSREDAVTDHRQVLTIDGLGAVKLVTEDPTRSVTLRGQATPAELRALDAALRQARFLELPAGTPGRGGGFVYQLTAPGGATKRYADGLGEGRERLRAVDAAVRAIIASVERAPTDEVRGVPARTRGLEGSLGDSLNGRPAR